MGIGTNFKLFRRKKSTLLQERLAIFSFYQESSYSIRISHPVYLLPSFKLTYLLPAQAAVLPIKRDDERNSEVGAAACLSLMFLRDHGNLFYLRIERWRGTATEKLHGLEIAVGYGWANQ